jgi:hypothetical protein
LTASQHETNCSIAALQDAMKLRELERDAAIKRCEEQERELQKHRTHVLVLTSERQTEKDSARNEIAALLDAKQKLQGQLKHSMQTQRQAEASVRALQGEAQSLKNETSAARTSQGQAEACIRALQGEAQKLKSEISAARASQGQAEASVQSLKSEISAIRKESGAMVRRYTETWRYREFHESNLLLAEPDRKDVVSKLLKNLSHKGLRFNGMQSKCAVFQNMRVLSVNSVHNPLLWSKYENRKQEIQKTHARLGIHAAPVYVDDLSALLGDPNDLKLDGSLNEVFLAHGCSQGAADSILQEGFDIRFSNTNGGSLYGQGMYFATEICKCHQYTGAKQLGVFGHIIIARVVLGDACRLQDKYDGKVPPQRSDGKNRFDSNAVDPTGSLRGQAHREYVIFDGAQAYPEMLITYEIAP